MNSVTIMGRLTKAPELKYTTTGKAVMSFTLAVDGFKKEDTDFINCVVWDKTAEYIANYHKTGNRLLVEGRLSVRKYESEGINKYITEVIVNRVTGIDFKPKDGSASEPIVEEEFEDMFADE